MLGCGFDGFEGQGEPHEKFSDVRTCPHFLARSPYVSSIWEYLTPFRNGGLDVFDLPHPLFSALVILDSELKVHEGEIAEALSADD
jgi:hypothetical protein